MAEDDPLRAHRIYLKFSKRSIQEKIKDLQFFSETSEELEVTNFIYIDGYHFFLFLKVLLEEVELSQKLFNSVLNSEIQNLDYSLELYSELITNFVINYTSELIDNSPKSIFKNCNKFDMAPHNWKDIPKFSKNVISLKGKKKLDAMAETFSDYRSQLESKNKTGTPLKIPRIGLKITTNVRIFTGKKIYESDLRNRYLFEKKNVKNNLEKEIIEKNADFLGKETQKKKREHYRLFLDAISKLDGTNLYFPYSGNHVNFRSGYGETRINLISPSKDKIIHEKGVDGAFAVEAMDEVAKLNNISNWNFVTNDSDHLPLIRKISEKGHLTNLTVIDNRKINKGLRNTIKTGKGSTNNLYGYFSRGLVPIVDPELFKDSTGKMAIIYYFIDEFVPRAWESKYGVMEHYLASEEHMYHDESLKALTLLTDNPDIKKIEILRKNIPDWYNEYRGN